MPVHGRAHGSLKAFLIKEIRKRDLQIEDPNLNEPKTRKTKTSEKSGIETNFLESCTDKLRELDEVIVNAKEPPDF